MKYIKNMESNFLTKVYKSVLSNKTFYLKDDDHKPVDFNGKTFSFSCQVTEV